MNQHLLNIMNLLQQDTNLSGEEKKAILKSLKDADKDFEITSFKLDRTEKVKRTTAILLEETIDELEQKRKAVEKQNRELEIESSLERIRARTMAMQHSDELADASFLLDSQVRALGIKTWGCAFNIYTDKGSIEWFSSEMGTMPSYPIPREKLFLRYYEEGQTGKLIYIETFAGEACVAHYDYLCTLPVIGEALKKIKEGGGSFPVQQIDHVTFFKYGYLLFITLEPAPGAHDIFIRFAKVFEQTYTRFLDLQNAEAQARESQVQLALERVRARTMAMQHSDELLDAATLLFQQIESLGAAAWNCSFNIWSDDKKYATAWNGTKDGFGRPFNTPSSEDVFFDFYQAAQQGEELYVKEIGGKDLVAHYDYLATLPGVGVTLAELKAAGVALPTFQVFNIAYFPQGYLMFITYAAVPEFADIFKRFAKVFDQTYTRFLDLQKAEAQAREAKIEAGLERVRSRAMAMQTSEELNALSGTVFIELTKLDLALTRCVIMIYDPATNDSRWWMANSEAPDQPMNFLVQYHEKPPYLAFIKAWQERQVKWTYTLEGKIKKDWDDVLFTETGLSQLPDFVIAGMKAPEQIYLNSSFFNFGNISLPSLEPLSEEHFDIMLRFAKVFDLTYTRFNDLKQAEAQAREATIEMSLERVRAKTMAMHNSKELKEVITLLSEQFQVLGFNIHSANFNTSYRQKDWDLWLYTPGSPMMQDQIHIPYFDHPYFNRTIESIAGGTEFTAFVFTKEEKDGFLDHIYANTLAKYTSEERKKYTYAGKGFAWSSLYLKNTAITIANYDAEPYSEDQNAILRRFGNVFEQTYTRFLDLQKAEAQARESQIQLALERGRTQSMIMQHSNELDDTLRVFHEQVLLLGINSAFSFLWLPDEEKSNHIFWAAWADQKNDTNFFKSKAITYSLDRNEPATAQCLIDWKSGEPVFSYAVPPEGVKNYFVAWQELIDGVEKLRPEHFTNGLYYVEAFMKYGCFGVMLANDLNGDEKKILHRFAIEFERAYTRFLDLQKAEGQAKEAQIEMALEKVRSRSMGMQKSEELKDVIQVVYDQFVQLHINTEHTGFVMDYKLRDDRLIWVAGKRGLPSQLTIPYFDCEYYNRFNEAKEKGLDFFVTNLNFEDKNNFYRELFKYIPGLPGDEREFYFSCPGLAISTVLLENVALYIENFEGIPYSDEDNAILMRFGKVFQQTYTRFLDLQKAEAQAKESQVEASLERVRSRTLAMQRSDELAETAAVLFKQLITLGIEPNRLYICIVKDDKGNAEFWITDEDGTKVSSAFATNLNDNPTFKKMFEGWMQEKKTLIIDMDGNELQDYFKFLMSINVPFKGGLDQKRRLQDIAYFSNGFIGIASPEEQPGETVSLLERFAAVFNLTYTRFNDLKVAEAHAVQAEEDLIKLQTEKKRAEDALAELRSTQTQLIQSEKMASLGELTAGIAHEIQNPLNFVNNFSEVSNELIEELKEESCKAEGERDKRLEEELLNDIKQNLEKINHHGKRADAIVKGMLQHSRASSATKELTDINKLADEYLRLAYHGLRAKDKSFNATLKTGYDESIENINIVPQDIGRVVLNLITNAFYAVDEKKKQLTAEKSSFENLTSLYEPTVSVSTKKTGDKVLISVEDNGNGIPQHIVDKIFQPFFTTKPTGQGTGLGLSLAYDIVKAHGGELKVETKEAEGSTFNIQLPKS